MIFNKLENYAEALKYIDEAIEINPETLAYTTKGYILYNQEKYEESIKCFNKAIELDEKVEETSNFYFTGLAFYMLKKYKKAIEYLNECLKSNPQDIDAYYFKGESFLDLREYDKARECFNKILK